MLYFIMANKDIVKASEVTVDANSIAHYDSYAGSRLIPMQSQIKYEMDDTAIYIVEKPGLFKTKKIEVTWKPKFNVSGSGTFYDKKGNEYNVSYADIKKGE